MERQNIVGFIDLIDEIFYRVGCGEGRVQKQ